MSGSSDGYAWPSVLYFAVCPVESAALDLAKDYADKVLQNLLAMEMPAGLSIRIAIPALVGEAFGDEISSGTSTCTTDWRATYGDPDSRSYIPPWSRPARGGSSTTGTGISWSASRESRPWPPRTKFCALTRLTAERIPAIPSTRSRTF